MAPTNGGRALYVMCRRDLPWAVRLVQSCHAVAQLMATRPATTPDEWGPYGPHLIALAVENEHHLQAILEQIDAAHCAPFHEPDLGNSLTAVAYWGPRPPAARALSLM